MKIEQQKQEFRPVVVTLESREEWILLLEVLHSAYTGKVITAVAAEFADDLHSQLHTKTTTV
jgi:hypothetical protein